jgi:hypothetical protein
MRTWVIVVVVALVVLVVLPFVIFGLGSGS